MITTHHSLPVFNTRLIFFISPSTLHCAN